MSGDPLTLDLGAGVTFELHPLDDGVKVRVVEADDALVVSETLSDREFFTSAQKRNTLANKVESGVSASLDGEAVAEAFRDKCVMLADETEEIEAALRSPTVGRVLDATERVTQQRIGDTSVYTVTLAHDGDTVDVEFTLSEWAHGGAKTLKERYLERFGERLDTATLDDEWETLGEAWDEDLEVVEGDDTDPTTALAEATVAELRNGGCEAFDSVEALDRNRRAAYYEADTSTRTSVGTDGPVAWLRGETFAAAVREAGGTHADVSVVATTLADEGVVYGGGGESLKKRIRDGDTRHRVYAFDPDALGVTNPTDTDLLDEDGGAAL